MEILSEFSFHSEDISFVLNKKPAIISWLSYSIKNENKILGDISFIFCSDEYLHKINLKHLNHDTLTDIMHLCGYNDKTTEDQNVMSAKEEFYLNLRNF